MPILIACAERCRERAFRRWAKREPPRPVRYARSVRCNCSGNSELTFLGHPLESLGRIFDAILTVIAFGWEQPDHLIGAAGGRSRDIAGGKIDGLSNGE